MKHILIAVLVYAAVLLGILLSRAVQQGWLQ